MRRRNGVTLTEVLIVTLVLGVSVAAVLYAMTSGRSEARRRQCQANLDQIARGMATYLGSDRYWPWPAGRAGCGTVANPQFGGAEWLASLYWTKFIPNPGVFLCPSSSDRSQGGADLGSSGTPGGRPLSDHAVSYAGMHGRSVGIYIASSGDRRPQYAMSKLAIRDDFPPNEAMACDDTEEPINHGSRDNGGMNVLFFDSHVEWWTHERVDLERGVGTGELVHLRN